MPEPQSFAKLTTHVPQSIGTIVVVLKDMPGQGELTPSQTVHFEVEVR